MSACDCIGVVCISHTPFSPRASLLPCRTKIQEQLAAGENVVLLANHQTEADPGVFAHMLASSHPSLATDVIYVAGDRVVTDALCKPFSMGRNLFCVHSKKHLDDVPELKASKMETNRKTLVAMQRAFNAGGTLVWIAPSGGRDRCGGQHCAAATAV
jgi:glycerol-3-phosphate O-acyltransferase